MPDPREHAENRGWIETIGHYIPGFRGYLRKENRREADELQREWLADRLQRSKRGMDEFALALTESGRLDEITRVERLRSKLEKILARIRGAMQGYSGFFDLVDINQDVLDRVSLKNKAEQDAATLLNPLIEQIEEIEDSWDQREDILKGLE